MKNTHIEHPEDSILTGDLSVLDWFCSMKGAKASLKIDGAPAVVWGTNPATGNFFVGTKSVFNKVKLKINESHDDIRRNHPDPDLRKKLHACFDYLPHTLLLKVYLPLHILHLYIGPIQAIYMIARDFLLKQLIFLKEIEHFS